MQITDKNAVTEGLANITLESLKLSEAVIKLVERALADGSLNSSGILKMLLQKVGYLDVQSIKSGFLKSLTIIC